MQNAELAELFAEAAESFLLYTDISDLAEKRGGRAAARRRKALAAPKNNNTISAL